ncbi:uncharacterized protein LOC130665927 [Microplitis mediator]|uniref:uncharacterized protein LOC130665927 n=1 Tax=Microplitis mediator TaxID=375433 RepID=UPI0025558402|nr:uncharacterized protein LOC130665927 [Microplitis mediator]
MKDLISDIGISPFSLIIDESTDVARKKVLCIIIRYYSHQKKIIVTTFYRLIKISDASANGIYSALTSQLKADKLPIENLVGIGVDGASVMVGCNQSVVSLLRKDLPDLIVMKCVCHSLHLCAEKATDVLPKDLEYLVREAHNWFSYSPKRLDEYRDLYETMNNGNRKPKKITGLSGTRWLARYNAIDTILHQWDELKLLFCSQKVMINV